MLTLRALRHAVALADHGSFVAAARAVHLTQPALSRSIQSLERQLGARLFDRAGGTVRPTDAGTIFLNHARLLIAQAEAVEREVGMLRRGGGADATIGAATYCAEGLVDIAAARLLRAQPTLRLSIVTDHWANLLPALRRRELDLVVGDTTAAEEDHAFHVEPLARAHGFFAVRPGHPLCALDAPELADVLRYPLVSTSRLTARVVEQLLKAAPAQTTAVPAIVCESFAIMKTFALESDAVALLLMRTMFAEVQAGALVPLPLRLPWLHGRFGIVTLGKRAPSAVSQRLVECLREVDTASDARARALEASLLAPVRPRRAGRRPRGAAD